VFNRSVERAIENEKLIGCFAPQSTFNTELTGHLKNEDFFDVETYPTTTFKLTKATKTGEGAYEISGNLTLHGVEKNITFPVTASRDVDTANFSAEFDINRKDFGIVYAGKTDDLIRDKVIIRLDFKATAKTEG